MSADPTPELLTLKEASERSGISVKTLRRGVTSGTLTHTKEQGSKGNPRYMVTLADVYTKWPPKPAPLRVMPLGDVVAISHAIKTKIEADKAGPNVSELTGEVQRLTAAVESMARELAQARHETHDLRGQVAQMHDQILKALPAPGQTSSTRPWWRFWTK